MQLSGVPDHGLADEHFGAAAGMPWQILSGPQLHVDATGAGDDSHRLECVGGVGSPPIAPRTARLPQPGQHDGDVLRLLRQRRVERGDLVIGGPTVHRDHRDALGLLGRLHHLRHREQRDVDDAA